MASRWLAKHGHLRDGLHAGGLGRGEAGPFICRGGQPARRCRLRAGVAQMAGSTLRLKTISLKVVGFLVTDLEPTWHLRPRQSSPELSEL